MEIKHEESLHLVGIACQPIRYKIFHALQVLETMPRVDPASWKGLYINKIADMIKADRRLVSFHLMTLLEHGFVSGTWGMITAPTSTAKGKAGKFYRITEKGNKIFNSLTSLIQGIEDM